MDSTVTRWFAVVWLCLMIGMPARGAGWEFDHEVVYVGLEGPDDVVNADLNGDGRMDILCSEGNIHWFENLGGDPPKWKRSEPVAPNYPDWSGERGYMAVWVGDFDGDGDVDIVAGAKGTVRGKNRPVLWFENVRGDGRAWEDHSLPEVLCGDHHDHSRCYDFNGDGRDEIIAQKYHGGGVYYLVQTSTSKDDWKAYLIGTGRAGVSLYDVNQDGKMDVLVDNTWLENPGDPARENWAVHAVPHAEKHVKNAAGDLNGDGITDFAHAEEEGRKCYVVLSPSWERVTLKEDGNGLHTMRLVDFDHDGDLDLLTADIHGGHAYVFENADAKGTKWIRHDLPTWSQKGSHNLWTADLNGDSRIDIFGKHYDNGSALEVWLNRCESSNAATAVDGPAFFREHWAQFDPNISNYQGPRWRINDEQVSVDPRFGTRWEAKANGLILIDVPEDLFSLDRVELYLELWGGHAQLENKRFLVNGRDTYRLPPNGTEEGHCTYSQPTIPLKLSNLVTGVNAFQFTCDRGRSFWGHYIVHQAAVRCYLKSDHADLAAHRLNTFQADVVTEAGTLGDRAPVRLESPSEFRGQIDSVDYFARYRGFDDGGLGHENDWHGFTLGRTWVNHVGSAQTPPFEVVWDTRMIPDQEGPMALRAVVNFKNGIKYGTPVLEGLRLGRKASVRMIACSTQPVHFASRANRRQEATFLLPRDISHLARAVLIVKTWGFEPGTIKEPFTVNGHPYEISKGDRYRSIIFSVVEVAREHLQPGENRIELLSNTEGHGIEVFLPGPVLMARFQ